LVRLGVAAAASSPTPRYLLDLLLQQPILENDLLHERIAAAS